MYETNGDFGQVRVANPIFSQRSAENLTIFTSCGWHRCNDLYHISQKDREALILVTVGGSGALRHQGKQIPLTPSTVAVLGEHTDQDYFTPPGGQWEFYWIHPAGAASHRILSCCSGGRPLVFTPPSIAEYTQRIERLLALQSLWPQQEPQACAVVSEILYRLLTDSGDSRAPTQLLSTQIMHFLETHYQQPLTIGDLAGHFHLSTGYLIRLFRTQTGFTPHEYLTRVRLSRAQELLSFTDLPLAQVAKQVGIPHTGRFIAQYKALRGTTPGAQRRRQRGYFPL